MRPFLQCYTISDLTILMRIYSLFHAIPIVPSIATLYTQNRKRHDATARQWTQTYAKPPPPSAPAAAADDPPQPNVSKGKNKADAQSVDRTGGSSSTSRRTRSTAVAGAVPPLPTAISAASTSNDVITIDSDEEIDNERSSTGSKAKNTKRKRASNTSSASVALSGNEVLDLVDSEEERTIKKSRRRTRGDRNSGAGVTAPSTQAGDIIVIEDD